MTGVPTTIFWGAGATAYLGMPTSDHQSKCIRTLALAEDSESLQSRVRKAVGRFKSDAFTDLLNILGDGGQQQQQISDDACDAMRRSWSSRDNDELRRRIMELRTLFDWQALQAVVRSCPGGRYAETRHGFKITDLFNVLDLHGQSGHGFYAGKGFLSSQRVVGARNALKMLLQAMFYVKWQQCYTEKEYELGLYYRFAVALGQRMQRRGRELAGKRHEDQEFYLGDVGFASMNYDPIGLWCQYVANRDLNRKPTVRHVDGGKIELFHDHAHFVAGARVKNVKGRPRRWHPMNESSVQRLNEEGHRIRVTKFLLPHGCICWRECPNCGKLSSYLGNSWAVASKTLIPPPPLRAFLPQGEDQSDGTLEEKHRWDEGAVDARECVHCGTLTYTQHTPTLMQSNLKVPPPSFIQEIQRDLRVLVTNAKHVVLLGYSLPPDDVIYRAFFASYLGDGNGAASEEVKCTVVDLIKEHDRWIGPAELGRISELHEKSAVGAAREIFGPDNVRFYGGGFPDVCKVGDDVRSDALERLLTWRSH